MAVYVNSNRAIYHIGCDGDRHPPPRLLKDQAIAVKAARPLGISAYVEGDWAFPRRRGAPKITGGTARFTTSRIAKLE